MYETIRTILLEQGKSFYWLSRQTGISEQAFSMMKKRGTRLSASNLAKVAKVLHLRMEQLLDPD